MPSNALQWWQAIATGALDEMEAAHAAVEGGGAGRRYATAQLNNAYAVMLSAQFQRFCRDLHTEAADFLASTTPVSVRTVVFANLTENRKLDFRNPNSGNIGSDFNRLGLQFWAQVRAAQRRNSGRQKALDRLNEWRNAIAHQDFSKQVCNGRTAVLHTGPSHLVFGAR